jgi:hypothetical protein
MAVLFFFIGLGLVCFFRWIAHTTRSSTTTIVVTRGALVCAPIGFLAGLGAFDYWVYYALGRRPARGPLGARRRIAGRTTSASIPTTR